MAVMMSEAQFPIGSHDRASADFIQSAERAVTSVCVNWNTSE